MHAQNWVRNWRCLIQAVGTIGGDLAKKALLHCLKSSDDLAVEAAEEALQHLSSADEAIGFSSVR